MTSQLRVVRVDRELEPFISMFPKADLNDPIAARQTLAGPSAQAPALDMNEIEIEDRTVPATTDVPVRIYRPHGGARCAIVWLHGGGFVMGGLDVEHSLGAPSADASTTVARS